MDHKQEHTHYMGRHAGMGCGVIVGIVLVIGLVGAAYLFWQIVGGPRM